MHHIVVKTTLFLVTGLVDRRTGSSRLSEIGGLVRDAPIIAVLFALPALSLAGLPPFSGFVAKFSLIDAGTAENSWPGVVTVLAVGLLTVFSMTKIWSGTFWGDPEDEPQRAPIVTGAFGAPIGMIGPTAFLAAVSIAIAIAAGPIYALAERTSVDLLEPARYIDAVLGSAR